MKINLFLILLTLILVGCMTETKTKVEEQVKFKTLITSLSSDSSVSKTVYFRNHFICLTDKKSLIAYTEELKPDSIFTSFLNTKKIDFIYVTQDTLLGVDNDDVYFFSAENNWTKTNLQSGNFEYPMFEDSNYFVYSCCAGEFGGAIFFYDKRTKRTYSCPATCTKTVNKIKNVFYVTNSLEHMSGSTEILKISDPSKLYELKADSLKHFCNWWTHFVTESDYDNHLKRFMVGTESLVDVKGVPTLTSFIYKDKLYNISTTWHKTFLNTIQNNTLVALDTIYDLPLIAERSGTKIYKNFYFTSLYPHHMSGFVFIKSDTINIVTFKPDSE
jgi:hypothetical protein